MARKNVHRYKLASATSIAASFNSAAFDVNQADNVFIILSTTGVTSNTGTFSVQARIKKDINNFSNWVTLTLDSTPTLASADADFGINLNQIPFDEARVVYTASGTSAGTVDIWIEVKQIGG